MSNDGLPALPIGHRYFVAGSGPLDFVHDWTDWLALSETITSSEWSTPDAELTIEAVGTVLSEIETPDGPQTGKFTSTQVTGGTAGNRAKLIEQIHTSQDRHPIRTITLHVIANWPA